MHPTKALGRLHTLEAPHRSDPLFDSSMVLLQMIIQIREAHSLAASPSPNTRREACRVAAQEQLSHTLSPPKPAARSRLLIGQNGPSDSARAAARGGRLRRTLRFSGPVLGRRLSALYALGGKGAAARVSLTHGVGAYPEKKHIPGARESSAAGLHWPLLQIPPLGRDTLQIK
jgi:hypothetical protein